MFLANSYDSQWLRNIIFNATIVICDLIVPFLYEKVSVTESEQIVEGQEEMIKCGIRTDVYDNSVLKPALFR